MPTCPSCHGTWPPGHQCCPSDGSVLVDVVAPTLAIDLNVAKHDLEPGTVVGEYRVEHKLGQGGMGAVYAARHPLIGKRAAIKVIRPELSADDEAVQRFVVEAQSVNQIGHPNIVDVFGFGHLPDGRSYFAMEWLRGASLADRMQARPLTLGESAHIIDAVARALEAAHAAGVIHRDLKPDNVFLVDVAGEAPQIKLLDFGLAKLSAGEVGMGRTRSGVMMGTPLYASPEQAKGTKVDAKTDVYALGVILYELATGTSPFMADSAVEVMAAHISEPAPPPIERNPELPPALASVIAAMLEKDPAARPSLREVRAVLAPFTGSTQVPPRWEPAAVWLSSSMSQPGADGSRPQYPTPMPVDQTVQARPTSRRMSWIAASAAAVMVVVVAGVVGFVTLSGGGTGTGVGIGTGVGTGTGSGSASADASVDRPPQTPAANGQPPAASNAPTVASSASPAASVAATDEPVKSSRPHRRPRHPDRADAPSTTNTTTPPSSTKKNVDVNAVHDPFAR